jgi:hypothetical protein
VREERVVLEDRVHVAGVRRAAGDVLAAQLDAPRVGTLEAGDDPQRRRLPEPGRAEHREELAARDLEVDRVDGDDVAVGLADGRSA